MQHCPSIFLENFAWISNQTPTPKNSAVCHPSEMSMATLERLAVPNPRPGQSKEVVLENNETKVASELHQAEKRRYASWIRSIRVRLQLVLQKKTPILEASSHSDTASQIVSNSASNTTSGSHVQNLPEDQWVREVPVSLPGVYSLPGSSMFVALPTEIPVPQ
jgi:hypothetical protein